MPSTSRNVTNRVEDELSDQEHIGCSSSGTSITVKYYCCYYVFMIFSASNAHNELVVENIMRSGNFDDMENSDTENEPDDSDDDNKRTNELTWDTFDLSRLKIFDFSEPEAGVSKDVMENFKEKKELDFYKIFVTDDLLNYMVTETNRYAQQMKSQNNNSRHARIKSWHDTTYDEMKFFLATIMWMGLVRLPQVRNYWSKNNIYTNKINSILSRNRFEILVRVWHFCDNSNPPENDRLYKITPLINMLVERFQYAYVPEENFCIDETLVPYRGRLSFKQYIPNKRHRFGIKLYKLCLQGGYTYNLKVYCGKDKTGNKNISGATNTVLELSDKLLDKGRTIYTDNFYSSVSLAHELQKRKTHLVGTLRSNRKHNPLEIVKAKLERYESKGLQSNTGCTVLKWKDKKDVLVISTKHDNSTVSVQRHGQEIKKPEIILDYNKCKAFIDLSDQLKAYSTSLRKGVKWYRKLAVELLTGTTLINAYCLHQKVTHKKNSITKFKELVVTQILEECLTTLQPIEININHILVDDNKKGRCSACYEKLKNQGWRYAQRKSAQTRLKCSACEKYFCLKCFFVTHNSVKK